MVWRATRWFTLSVLVGGLSLAPGASTAAASPNASVRPQGSHAPAQASAPKDPTGFGGLYVDWVTPLQEQGPTLVPVEPLPGVLEEADAPPVQVPAGVLSGLEPERLIPIPEAGALALVGVSLLPVTGLLLRHRRKS